MRGSKWCLVGLLLTLGCRPPITSSKQIQSGPRTVGCEPADCGDPARVVALTCLGVSGLLIQHQGPVLLRAPFFTNPSFGQRRPRIRPLLRSTPRISADTNA